MKSSYKFHSKKYWNWEVIPLELKTKFRVVFNNLMLKMLIKQYWLLWEICSFSFLKIRCFFCMTSLAVTSSTLKTSMKLWGTAFKFWLRLNADVNVSKFVFPLSSTHFWNDFLSNSYENITFSIQNTRTHKFNPIFTTYSNIRLHKHIYLSHFGRRIHMDTK